MNRTLIQEIQNGSSYFNEFKSQRKVEGSLLQLHLKKYRGSILEKNYLNNNCNRTSAIKQKYQNFGQQDFVKRLKLNSTRQLDRKSAKAIQKYLHDINEKKINPGGYILRTNSFQSLNYFNANTNQENQEIDSTKLKNLGKSNSEVFLLDSFKKNNANSTAFQDLNLNKNYQNLGKITKNNYKLRISQNQLSNKLDDGMQQQIEDKTESKYGIEMRKYKQEIQNQKRNANNNNTLKQKTYGGISFRAIQQYPAATNYHQKQQENYLNQQQIHDLSLSSQKNNQSQFQLYSQNFSQNSISGNPNYEKSQNHFYYKYQQNRDFRPTIDTESNISKQRQIKRIMNRQDLQHQIKMLRQKNKEQDEIIRLQQVMIEKLNDRLSEVTQKSIRESKLGQTKQQSRLIKEGFDKNNLNSSENIVGKHQLNSSNNMNLQQSIQQHDRQWSFNIKSLKQILSSLNFQPPKYSTQYQTQQQTIFQPKYSRQYESKNQFYHLINDKKIGLSLKMPPNAQMNSNSNQNKKYNYFKDISSNREINTEKYSESDNELDFQLVDQTSRRDNNIAV